MPNNPAFPACPNTCPKPGGSIEVGTVQLSTGAQVCTWCPLWRAECQDRHKDALRVMDAPNRLARRSLVDVVGVAKGDTYKARLEAEVRRMWDARYKAAG